MSLVRQLALVSQSAAVPLRDVLRIASALQKQATRDLAPIWELHATVDAFGNLADVPAGYWPILILDSIAERGVAGVHHDRDGQPFALVHADADLDRLSLTCSHEALEMLVDPFGNRLVAGDSPWRKQGRVAFLLEVADPCQSAVYGYSVNGLLVSDFYTPAFFDPVAAPSVRYSFTGALTKPRDILPGGYLSWRDRDRCWWRYASEGARPDLQRVGPLTAATSLRAQLDRRAGHLTRAATAGGRAVATRAGVAPEAAIAHPLEAELAAVLG